MRKIVILLLVTLSYVSVAQETVKWASEVMFVTSETTALQYAASQCLHQPNIYPSGGESPNAWRPSRSDTEEYIVIKFDEPIRAQQIAIAETENPGSVSKVFAYDSLDNEYLLFDLNPRPIPLESRLLNLFFEKTPYRIAYIRVDLSCGEVPGFNSIDAIGLSSSNIPVSVLIDLANNANNNLDTEKLSTNVNSDYREIGPLLSPDGKTLYFARANHPDNVGGIDDPSDIWYSELDEETQEWLPAKNIGSPLNTMGANYISSITQVDDDVVLLLGNKYEKRGLMGVGISMSRSKGSGKWEKPTNLYIENDYNYSEKVDFYMSQDTEILISSVERDDTNGDRDLCVSFLDKNTGNWTEPVNLGTTVNSADEEYAPFLDKDNETLYFSSKGFRGYGGADIFVTKRLDDTWLNWSAPENMGRGVNGKSDDTYFNIPSTGNHAYFTRGEADENTDVFRFRVDELFIESDLEETELIASAEPFINDVPVVIDNIDEVNTQPVITSIEDPLLNSLIDDTSLGEENTFENEEIIDESTITEQEEGVKEEPIIVPISEVFITVHGQVFNGETNKSLASKIVVERLPDGVKIGETYTDASGIFEFKVRPGARYGFLADKEGFLAKNEHLDLNDVTESTTISKDLYLNPIRKGAAIVINNIFFDFDKSDLKTASYSELRRVVELLKEQKVGKIEIAGYSDSVGDDDYNQWLSKQRAQAVYKYFINQGVGNDRMISKLLNNKTPL